MKHLLIAATLLLLPACSQSNVKDLLSNVDKDCVIHGTFSAATGVPGNVNVAGTIDCAPAGTPPTTTTTTVTTPVKP